MISTSLASLEFKQHELTLTGTNNRGCLAVYPQGKKSRQRVAAGDSTGSVHVFTVGKHHDVKTDFQTPPMPKPLDRLTLFEDQLFTVHGAAINAYTKKGKPFFSFETNLTEAIKVFKIHTPFIFAGGEYTFTTFRETEEVGFFMPPDKVNDMVFSLRGDGVAADPKIDQFDCYLACNDRVLRSVNSCKIQAEAGCEAPLSALTVATAPHDSKKRDIVYGTSAGTFGAFTVNANNDLIRRYSSIPSQRLPAYTCMTSCDINQDGVPDIILAREDGTIEAHTFSRDSTSDEPNKVWSSCVGEFVNSIATGMITNVEAEEVIVHTYGGKIISFSLCPEDVAANQQKVVVPSVMQSKPQELPTAQQQIKKNASFALTQSSTMTSGSFVQDATSTSFAALPSSIEITHAKVRETQEEIDRLKRQLEEKTRAYAAVTGAADSTVIKAVASEFRVRESLSLDSSSNVLRLVVETDCALQHVGIRCDRQLDLVQDSSSNPNVIVSVAGGNGKSTTQLQQQSPGPASSSSAGDFGGSSSNSNLLAAEGPFYAVARSTDDASTKVSLAFRTHEGEPATIQVFVLPKAAPRTSQLKLLAIKPLALHHRVGEGDVPLSELPLSTIRISGTFSIKDAHSWALKCLPDVPDMIAAQAAESVSLFFKNEFHQTFLVLKYAKGDIECRSDNLSALSIFKDHVTREATLRKIPVKIQSEPQEESVVRHLKLLDPLLSKELKFANQAKLVEALKEIEAQENDNTFLSDEYKEILLNAATLEREEKSQPGRVEYLRRCYHKLFADRAGFYGKGVTERLLRQLSQLLEDYSLGAMLDFFQREK